MADLSIKYGLKKDLPAYSAELEGAILITTDERAVYANIGGGQFRIGDFTIVNDLNALPDPTTAGTQLFFVKSTNALAVSNGTQWIQVNTDTDTGATSVVFSGGSGQDGSPGMGEFISGVSYNAGTRALTFNVTKLTADIVTYGAGTVKSALDNKTDHIITGTNGRALVFNESDGGGVKFEHSDGTMSFVGVNDGGENGIAGQLYAVKKNEQGKSVGSRLNITKDGFFYTNGNDSAAYTAEDELVTKKDLTSGATSKTVYLEDASSGQSDYAKVYKLFQGSDSSDMSKNTLVGTINIPKDLVIESGSVGTVTADDEPYAGAKEGDKYIDLVIQNQTEHLYIPANALVDIYTTQQNASQVQLSIDSNNEISAFIVAGSIGTTEIADGAVTLPKLSQELQNTIANKVDHILTHDGSRALVFNETDGGGAKFEHADGTYSFIGVNNGGAGGLTAQIYSKDKDTNVGTRINVTTDGIYYTNGLANGSYVAGDEIATKKDIESARLVWGTFVE